MNIIFKNKGTLSLLDLTTMGDSCKRDDASKIGKFDSGLKYALSILYRNGFKVEILSGNSKYTFSSKVVTDEITSKAKELLVINEERNIVIDPKENCNQCKDLYFDGSVNTDPHNSCEGRYCNEFETSSVETYEHITAFSPQLGYEWKVWMAIRELYSNCLDESGKVIFSDDYQVINNTDKTEIIIYDNGTLSEIITNWNNYFLSEEEALYSGNGIKIYQNKEEYLRFYKNKILIFEDKNVKSKYIYDYSQASIDEMRLLNNKETYVGSIVYNICNCNSVNFIRDFINHSEDNYFESTLDFHYTLNKIWITEVNQRYQELDERGEVFIVFSGLYQRLIENTEINIGVKKVKYNSPSYYWADAKVELVKQSPVISKEETFEDKIKNICKQFKFEIKHQIIESKISGFTCISDVNKKILYVSNSFTEENMWEMIKAHFRIDSNDDPDYCFKEYIKQLK